MHPGLEPHTPAALVERATLPGQRTLVGTLQSLPALAQGRGATSPALILIGSVVGLHAVLAQGGLPPVASAARELAAPLAA
jgi:siroheme synthase